MLDAERHYFDANFDELRSKYLGRVVLIKGDALVGAFDSEDAAIAEGARRFGLSSFMVRRVEEAISEVSIPALALGLLRADPSFAVHRADD